MMLPVVVYLPGAPRGRVDARSQPEAHVLPSCVACLLLHTGLLYPSPVQDNQAWKIIEVSVCNSKAVHLEVSYLSALLIALPFIVIRVVRVRVVVLSVRQANCYL